MSIPSPGARAALVKPGLITYYRNGPWCQGEISSHVEITRYGFDAVEFEGPGTSRDGRSYFLFFSSFFFFLFFLFLPSGKLLLLDRYTFHTYWSKKKTESNAVVSHPETDLS